MSVIRFQNSQTQLGRKCPEFLDCVCKQSLPCYNNTGVWVTPQRENTPVISEWVCDMKLIMDTVSNLVCGLFINSLWPGDAMWCHDYTPLFNEVERGVYWYHLVRLSVCGQNRVRSVSSTILIGSISYLHILSSNFRRCVACNARFKIKKCEILANFLNL